ncbi:MAG: exosortase F system-associated membrane protein [Flavobacteriales bacterium]
MNKWLRYSIAGILTIGLILIRLNEESLFYDPLLYYFKNSYEVTLLEIDITKHLISVTIRYGINTLLSIGIIYMLFNKKNYIKISGIVFLIGWVIFLPIYYLFINTEFEYSLMIGFYIRRFLIQPIIGIILILALFYLEKIKR